ncbi:ABC transporter substrate-binding protein [Mariniphaga sp.]|uniref:ABC transporter substrate-binding protein n=1 Tax=Mariniphaga sp. TaxID=1954475 RepID=UPI003563A68F
MHRFFFIFILMVFFSGCNTPENNKQRINSNHYAHGFQIDKKESITSLTVFNPWEKAENVSVQYFLVEKNKPVPDSLVGKRIIRTPVERVICLSTTHIGFLDALEETTSVVGISGSQYVSNQKVRKRMEEGEVPDVGYGQNLNYELMVSQKPELVLVYGIGSEVTSYVRKLEELEIPVVMVAEYLEETPLGKAEWIKFFGALFKKENEAQHYFEQVENEYHRLKKHAAETTEKPKVLVGSPYKDSWWIPGGNSYLANLIADAGGDYLGKTNPSNESYVISFEHALALAGEADVWINIGNLASKDEILSTDERFKNFKVFNNGKLFNNIKRLSQHGGNDFWESGTVNPHAVLHDLIAVFHPELAEKDMVYYQEIK